MHTLTSLALGCTLAASAALAPRSLQLHGHLTYQGEPVTLTEMVATRQGNTLTMIGKDMAGKYTLTLTLTPIPTTAERRIRLSPRKSGIELEVKGEPKHYFCSGQVLAKMHNSLVSVTTTALTETDALGKPYPKPGKLGFAVRE